MDVLVMILGYLRITELLGIECTSKSVRGYVNKALKQPRDRALCNLENEFHWLHYALKRCPRVKSIWWTLYEDDIRPLNYYVYELYDREYTFCLYDRPEITMSHWFRNSPCTKFLTSIRVDSLSILDHVPDRRAVLPQLETLTVYDTTAALHILKTKWFLTPDWTDVDIRFDHHHIDIHTYCTSIFWSALAKTPRALFAHTIGCWR